MWGFGTGNVLLFGWFLVYNVIAINKNSFNVSVKLTVQGVPQKDLNKVLLFLQQHPSDESDECYSIVLKIGLSLSAKKKERAITQKEHILKFTKKEIDSMPEPIRILLL